ncbi:MAG: ABC transporter transmembrane domain-containing protein [Rhodobacteraceae bacterium]|nr:ABC transporter transmembrane domain-containing protein [Paracoccaceae bacterium]
MRHLIRLFYFLEPYRTRCVLTIVVLCFTAMITLILPVFVRQFIDGFATADLARINQIGILAFLATLLLGFGTSIRYVLVTRLGEQVIADIRKELFAHTIRMSQSFYENLMTGEILSRINTDTTLVLTVISSSISVALRNTLLLCGGLILMLITSFKLTLLTIVLVPFVLLPILFLTRKLRNLTRENQDRIAEGSGNVSEALNATNTIQANNHEELSIKAFFEITDRYIESANRRIFVRGLMTMVIISVSFTAVGSVIYIGTRDMLNGVITPGELTQFVIYAVMVGGSVTVLSEVWGELVRAAGATERLFEILEIRDSVEDPPNPLSLSQPVKGTIEFRNVSFQYQNRPEISVLDNVSFTVQPKETVAIVGPSGAGKTSTFQLLLRFFDPQQGTILIEGIDIREITKKDLRDCLALVPQDPVVFSGTARENMRFGRPDATDEEVVQAAISGAAHDFLDEFPGGYDTLLGERGMLLSGGQKQRIALSRAILRSTPILLLDEATSSLDSVSEFAVQEALNHMTTQTTTIVIAHRLATVKKADRILVFDKGRIVAEGTHEQLVTEGGLYAKLATLQFN